MNSPQSAAPTLRNVPSLVDIAYNRIPTMAKLAYLEYPIPEEIKIKLENKFIEEILFWGNFSFTPFENFIQ